MNKTNLWKLFSGDIEGWVGDHCKKNCIDIQTAHWMMNYGYYDIVSNKLRRKELIVVNIADEKAIRFRLNRKEGKPNPYDGVCDLTNKEAQQIKNGGELETHLSLELELMLIIIPAVFPQQAQVNIL